jgi:hypothetical protein
MVIMTMARTRAARQAAGGTAHPYAVTAHMAAPILPGSREKSSVKPSASFDDLVGAGEDRWRNRYAQHLRGLEVDHQLECRRLLDRQIGRRGARENPADIGPGPTIGADGALSIADQATGRDGVARSIDCRNGMACR